MTDSSQEDHGADVFQWTKFLRYMRISRSAKTVAFVLATFADPDGTNAFPGTARLAAACPADYKTVKKAMAELLTAGLIEQTQRAGGVRGKNVAYRLTIQPDLVRRAGVMTPTEFENEVERIAAANRRDRGTGAKTARTSNDANQGEADQVQGRKRPVLNAEPEEVRGNSAPVNGEVRGNSAPQYGVIPSAIPIPLPEPLSTFPSDDEDLDLTGHPPRESAAAPEDPDSSVVEESAPPTDLTARPRCPHGRSARIDDGRPRCPDCRGAVAITIQGPGRPTGPAACDQHPAFKGGTRSDGLPACTICRVAVNPRRYDVIQARAGLPASAKSKETT